MKINEIIREKRKELSLTQEQIADFLGVSTPAVNKWETPSFRLILRSRKKNLQLAEFKSLAYIR